MATKTKRNWRGYVVVLGAVLVQLTLGTIFTCGNLGPYLVSYLRNRQGSNVTSAYIVWINALQTAGHGLLMPIGGAMERRLGPRLTGLIGSLAMSCGTALTYFTVQHSFPLTLVTYGLLYGLGISVAYIAMIAVGMKWFPNNRGVVNGIIVGAFGFGSFAFNQVQTAFLNPDNVAIDAEGYFSDTEVLDRVPTVFLLLGGVYAVIQLIGAAMVTDNPRAKATASTVPSLSPRQVLRHKEFYMLFFSLLLTVQTITYFNSMYKTFGSTFISDDHFLSLIGAFAAIFNAGGRAAWGALTDRFHYKKCMGALCAIEFALLLSLQATPYGGKAMYTTWVFMMFLVMSGVYTLVPTCSTRIFGPKHAGQNYGMIFFNAVIGAPMTALLSQYLSEHIKFVGMFYLLGGFSLTCFIITMTFNERSIADEVKGPPPPVALEKYTEKNPLCEGNNLMIISNLDKVTVADSKTEIDNVVSRNLESSKGVTNGQIKDEIDSKAPLVGAKVQDSDEKQRAGPFQS